jgi:anaerobic magnesium-protoporphyrin IX monomethyl ester cyclase
MNGRSILFVQLPLVTKPQLSEQEQEYYDAYWAVMGRIFDRTFPQGDAYTIPELPLWITRLAPVARRAGWTPAFVDLAPFTGPDQTISIPRLADVVAAAQPAMYALSPYTANYHVAVALVAAVKERLPDAISIVGGAHASELARACIEDGFDYAVAGRGEPVLDYVLRESDWSESNGPRFPGLWTQQTRQTAPASEDRQLFRSYVENEADYSVIPSSYGLHYGRFYATLGCPYHCSFCADTMWIAMRPYQRDLTRVRSELFALKERFGPATILVGDEVFTMNAAYCSEVISILGEVGVPWFCQTRANLLLRDGDKDLLRAMARAGCRMISIGAESTDEAVIDALGKRVTHDQVEAACARAKDSGLRVLTYWMVGGPNETHSSAAATLDAIIDLVRRGYTDLADYFICTPYPGTLIYRNPEKFNVRIARRPWKEWREDSRSVMSTATLRSDDIYSLWLHGLRRIAGAVRTHVLGEPKSRG